VKGVGDARREGRREAGGREKEARDREGSRTERRARDARSHARDSRAGGGPASHLSRVDIAIG